MFGSEVLEVAAGVIFVYILVSVICSAVREGIEAWLKTRAAYLEYGIRELLQDKQGQGLAKSIYTHPLIFGLFSGDYKPGPAKRSLLTRGGDLPSYLPSANFALALIDLAARGPNATVSGAQISSPISTEGLRKTISNLGNPAVERVFVAALDAAQGDLNKLQTNLETWYDSSMSRVAGWYKRSTQWIIFAIGLTIAAVLNVNTITIADYLYTNNTARAAVLARVQTATGKEEVLKENYEAAKKDLDSMGLPIGWTKGWGAPRQGTDPLAKGVWNNAVYPILGLLFTAFAASMGAPFWFDMLSKVMVIRSTVKPNEKSPEEASENRPSSTSKAGGTPAATPQAGGAASTGISPTGNLASAAIDPQNDVDGCEVEIDQTMLDENLPAAEGGVALT